jgi:hypothetical protein
VSAAEPYERLAALAEEELALVTREELPTLEELDSVLTERDLLVASLPPQAPAVAAPALARAAALQERTTTELAARAAEVRRSLGIVEQGRRTARGYGDATPLRGVVDLAG